MKKSSIFLFLLVASTISACAQYLSFSMASNGTNNISVPEGEVWQLAVYSWFRLGGPLESDGIVIYPSASSPQGSWIGKIPADGTSTSNARDGACLVGPSVLKISANVANYLLVFKKIVNDSYLSVSENAVVIPSTAESDVDIKLEQSADNVTWTECLPGTYNSSTVKRFFRLRAVEK